VNPLGSAYLSARRVLNTVVPQLKEEDRKARMTEDCLQEWRNHENTDHQELLQSCLHYTAENVPFYREWFAKHPDMDPLELSHWPVLDRQTLMNNFDRLTTQANLPWDTWLHASGGSTGQPVAVLHDEWFAAKAQALRKLCGPLFLGGPYYNQLILWGTDQEVKDGLLGGLGTKIKDDIRQFLGIRTVQVNTCDFAVEKLQYCAEVLRRQKPEYIFGYASSVYELARYLEEKQFSPPRAPKAIATTAETLYPFMRECIERVFRCRVTDHYGSREVGPISWQHESGKMYFPKFFSKIEVVDEHNQPVKTGERGRILATTLHNQTMPLIRYDIGDLGVAAEDAEYAGYQFAALESVTGRASETFINAEGTRVAGLFFIDLFYFRPWLDQFHVVQRDYDVVEILYVVKPPYKEPPDLDRDEIEAEIQSIMTDQCKVIWTAVDETPVTASGKRLFLRSELH
jgi:phenylacetate-CoA ligase